MKIRFTYLLSCLLLAVASISFSQNANIDSLLGLLKTDLQDTCKILHLYQLSDECEMSGRYQDGLSYSEQLLELADRILIDKMDVQIQLFAENYKSRAYNMMGLISFAQGNYPEALKDYFASIKIKEKMGNKPGIASSYNNIGNVYVNQRNYPEALKNYLAALKILKEMCNHKSGSFGTRCRQDIAGAYANIGVIYKEQGNYQEALKNHFLSLKIMEEIDFLPGIAFSYGNIGNVYDLEGDYEKAFKYDLDALKIYESLGEQAGIAGYCSNIGLIFSKQKKYKEAEKYMIRSAELSKEIGFKEILRDAYYNLANLDSIKGDFKGAYKNHKMYILYRDSLDNEETRKKTIQSQMTFDFEKKEAVATAEHKKELENQEILAEEKSRKQKIVILFVVSGLLLVMVFAGFIFRSLKTTRKQKDIIEKQKNIVEMQKLEVEQQKLLVEEHQKDIIDSITYAKRIQQSLLPTEKYIDKALNRLMKR